MADYLHTVKHATFLRNLEGISKRSHVSVDHLKHLSVLEVCDEDERSWVLSFKDFLARGRAGLILVGETSTPPLTKLSGIAATFLRNFKDAKLVSLGMLVASLTGYSDEDVDVDILLIPDLYLNGMDYTKKDITKVYAFLLERFIANKMTIAYVETLVGLHKGYGKGFHALLSDHFDISQQVEAVVC